MRYFAFKAKSASVGRLTPYILNIYIHTYIHTYIRIYIHTYTHTHTHTHTHIHNGIRKLQESTRENDVYDHRRY